MARIPRPLTLVCILAAALILGCSNAARALPASGLQPEASWYRPILLDGKAFPVLLSAQGKWLNWRDTYGAPRMRQGSDGVWRQTGTHQGIDIFAEQGTPLVAIAPGVVENVGWTFYSGYRVGIRGADGRYWFYAHLLRDLPVTKGSRVAAGQTIGRLGSSGYGPEGTSDEFPPHVHLGLQTAGGAWLNQEPMLRELYAHTTAQLRARVSESHRMLDAARLMRGRAYLPGAPVEQLAQAAASQVDASRSLMRSLIYP